MAKYGRVEVPFTSLDISHLAYTLRQSDPPSNPQIIYSSRLKLLYCHSGSAKVLRICPTVDGLKWRFVLFPLGDGFSYDEFACLPMGFRESLN